MTSTEWSTLYGGKKPVNPNSASASFRRLPYDHCALSLQLFENPLCDTEGNVFDLLAIVPYLKKYKTNPVTGKVKYNIVGMDRHGVVAVDTTPWRAFEHIERLEHICRIVLAK